MKDFLEAESSFTVRFNCAEMHEGNFFRSKGQGNYP